MNIENQNYKILVSTQQEAEEIQKIFFACGYKWAWQRYAEQREVRLGFFIKTFHKSRSLVETTCTDHQEITLPELREVFQKSPWGQIESLKAQLAQYQSDDYVLVPKDQIEVFWQDDDEPENFCSFESDFNCLGDCLDLNDIMTINKHHQAYIKTEKMYGTWFAEFGHPKEKANFHVGTHQECLDIVAKNKAMIEAQEQHNAKP